jgi:hypothetical protein
MPIPRSIFLLAARVALSAASSSVVTEDAMASRAINANHSIRPVPYHRFARSLGWFSIEPGGLERVENSN